MKNVGSLQNSLKTTSQPGNENGYCRGRGQIAGRPHQNPGLALVDDLPPYGTDHTPMDQETTQPAFLSSCACSVLHLL